MRKSISNQEEPNIEGNGENTGVAEEVKVKKAPSKFKKAIDYMKANVVTVRCIIAGFFVFSVVLTSVANVRIGYAVVLNNKTVGYVSEKDLIVSRIDTIEKEILDNTDEDVYFETELVPTFVIDTQFADEDVVEQKIKSELSYYKEAASIYIDGQFAFAVKDEKEAQRIIKKYQDSVRGDGTVLSVECDNEITFVTGKVIYTHLLDEQAALAKLGGTDSDEGLYTVEEGDTLWNIGMDNDIPTDYLMVMNNLESEVLQIGTVLRIKAPVPMIDVKVLKDVTYTEIHPFETEYRYDKTLRQGSYRTLQRGSNGETKVRATVTYINGSEVGREITEETVISETVTEIRLVGTKPKEKTDPTGTFRKPISGGYVSSAFGNRSRGYHTGVDWAVSYGTPIYASDGGTVTASGWGGGYGYMIKINHGNGYETLYAHCSKLAVSNGKKVAKGDVIAYVGSTGNSTGPHLHFEIRSNGTYLDPTKYCGQ